MRSRTSIVVALVHAAPALAGTPEPGACLPQEIGTLVSSESFVGDFFGASIEISGSGAVIGAPAFDPFGMPSYVSFWEQGQGGPDTWQELDTVIAPAGVTGVGWSVGIDGPVAVAGAPFTLPGGLAFVLARDGAGSTWSIVATLAAPDPRLSDHFGFAVTVQGTTVIVGAPQRDGLAEDEGAVFVFDRDRGGVDNWGLVVELAPPDSVADGSFGGALDLDAGTVVVGSRSNIVPPLEAAYVFEQGPDRWTHSATLTAPGGGAGDNFGTSVAIDGDAIVVGADHADQETGSAGVFRRGGGNDWNHALTLLPSVGGGQVRFGNTVRIRGDTILVGAPGALPANPIRQVFVFRANGPGTATWQEAAVLTAEGQQLFDSFGEVTDLDDDGNALVAAAQTFVGDLPSFAGDVFAFTLGCVPPCAEDLDGDGVVGIVDVLAVLSAWGGPGGDVTGDGMTDILDFLAVLSAWGPCL